MTDKRLELIDWIKDSLILSNDVKINLINRVDTFTNNEVLKLIELFQKESNYIASDREGILESINKYVDIVFPEDNAVFEQ